MRNFLISLSFLAVLNLFNIGCTETAVTEPGDPPVNLTIPKAQFSDIQVKVFTPRCDKPGCHGNTNNQADLFLTEGKSYGSLVGVPSLLFPGMTRVIPDSSSISLIIKILKGEVSPRMPQDGPFLEVAIIDSITKWIDNGAMNN